MITVEEVPARRARASTAARSFGEVSYSKIWRSSQPSLAGRGVTSFTGRFDSGLYAVHAAVTAAVPSPAGASKIAICVSGSGVCNTTRSFAVTTDQPEGTVKVAPPAVTRGVSADTRSGALLSWAAAEIPRGLAELEQNAMIVKAGTRKERCKAGLCFMGLPPSERESEERDLRYRRRFSL